jgi:hypothetical protein
MAHTKTLSPPETEAKSTPFNPAYSQAIQEQLVRILAHPAFRNSKRYPNFLRYVVELALKGQTENLKERTIGIDVFERNPDYDTNTDHVVRTTAGEIRKRIAQYYQDPGHESELRISLPSGSYVPEFQWPSPPIASPRRDDLSKSNRQRRVSSIAAVIAFALVILGIFWTRHHARETALDQFWNPVLGSSNTVLFCLGIPPGVQQGSSLDPGNVTLGVAHQNMAATIGLGDAITLARVTSLLGSRGKAFTVRSELNSTLDDLRTGPAILIGGFNNDWTMRLTRDMRFGFDRDPDSLVFRIRDKQDATANWALDMSMPVNSQTADYALISRVYDTTTGRTVVVAAGIGAIGTMAAGEFLTDPQYFERLARQAPRDWEHKNVQVVITAQVINGHAGPPRVVTAAFW